MNIPNVVPHTPIMESPQLPAHPAPEMPTPSAIANLSCVGCGNTLPQLSDVAPSTFPKAFGIIAVIVLFGGVFGLLAWSSSRKPRRRYPTPPRR